MKKRSFEAVILIAASIYVLYVLFTIGDKPCRKEYHDVLEQIKMEMIIQ